MLKLGRDMPPLKDAFRIRADVRNVDWNLFQRSFIKAYHCPDVVYLDPPWKISNSNPTTGLALSQDTTSLEKFETMPFKSLMQ